MNISNEERVKNLFLAGCGVGNKIAILPTSSNPGNLNMLEQFINTLKNIDIVEEQIIPIIDSKQIPFLSKENLDSKKKMYMIELFLENMSKIPEMIKNISNKDEYKWFEFGRCLYEVTTTSIFGGTSCEKKNKAINELENLVNTINLTSNIKEKVDDLLDSAKTQVSALILMKKVNEIAESTTKEF